MEKNIPEIVRDRFGAAIRETVTPNDRRVYITVDKTEIPAVCRFLHHELGGRLCIATGTDTRSGVEILYHFMFPAEHLVMTMKTLLSKPAPEIESVGSFYPAAVWIEREIHDLLGVVFRNHPDPRRILMADDWPEDVYPLRRDFTGLEDADMNGTGACSGGGGR